jgi:NDP-sugar pyrophosphorylase family protein
MIIIPICGEGRRFSDIGYKLPKFRLPVGGKIVLDYVINSFPSDAEILIVVNNRESADYLINRYNNDRFEIQFLPQKTKGQAHTVELCLTGKASNKPMTIFNCDTAFKTPVTAAMLNDTGCFLDVTAEQGDHWSFVEEDVDGQVVRVTEKERISDNTSTGLYHFGTIQLFLDCLASEKEKKFNVLDEQYVAPLYNHLLERGVQVSIHKRDVADILKFGTPTEYEVTREYLEKVIS